MADLLETVTMGWVGKAVAVAARLGIADRVAAQGPQTVPALAAATGSHTGVLLRLLRLLAAHGIFAVAGDRIENTPESLRLTDDHPLSVRHFCMLAGEQYYDAWGALGHSVATGESAFAHVFGGSIYDRIDADAELAQTYDLAMRDLARPAGFLLARTDAIGDAIDVVDVGGGNGEMLRQILAAHPAVRGVCFDRADVCARAVAEPRLRFVAGDFFGAIPPGADLYLLKNVLHNWNDDHAVRILMGIAAAMRAGARLLVLERLVEPDEASPSLLLNALLQIVICQEGVRDRSAAELAGLLGEAGLRVTGDTGLATGHRVVECVVEG